MKVLIIGNSAAGTAAIEAIRAHDKKSEIWLVFHKKHSGIKCIEYNDSVEEALCFGWIDGNVQRLDEDRYRQVFMPRRAGLTFERTVRTKASFNRVVTASAM